MPPPQEERGAAPVRRVRVPQVQEEAADVGQRPAAAGDLRFPAERGDVAPDGGERPLCSRQTRADGPREFRAGPAQLNTAIRT